MNSKRIGDVWGGMTAMLVALPQSIAFGIIVFSGLGQEYVSTGALAGAVGAILTGILSPLFGATPRLISSPCAPSAAFLAGLLSEPWLKGHTQNSPETVILVVALTVFFAGVFQVIFSLLGGGKIIKYIPYPVVTGYLSAVGIIIFIGQLPRLTGVSPGNDLWQTLASLPEWSFPSILIGLVVMLVMYLSPKITKKIPAPLIGLAGGVVTYFLLSIFYPAMLSLDGNRMVIGSLQRSFTMESFLSRFDGISNIDAAMIRETVIAGATLAIVLSIDTLKTCVIVDSITRTRSNSNRELFGQGIGNIAASVAGGIAGAGTLGATLVNLSSGAVSRLSGVFSGIFSLVTFVVLAKLVAWAPVPALAGILLFVAVRTIDWNILKMLTRRAAIFDFMVIIGVIAVALKFSLMAAAGTGFALSTIFFLKEQITGTVIRRKNYGNKIFSKRSRLSEELKILRQEGGRTAIFELQGNLFFGNTDRFYTDIIDDLSRVQFIILNLRLVQTIDSTAVHMFTQIDSMLSENKGRLIVAGLPHSFSNEQSLKQYFHEVGLEKEKSHILFFDVLYDALEWVEDYILNENKMYHSHLAEAAKVSDIELLNNLSPKRIRRIKACFKKWDYNEGETIFSAGDTGDELFFIRRGLVKIMLELGAGKYHHLATFGRGDFFGDMAFVDHEVRSADAIAAADTSLYVLSRKRFEKLVKDDPELGKDFYESMVKVLSHRFRSTHLELRSLE